jgi:hypothetical protein
MLGVTILPPHKTTKLGLRNVAKRSAFVQRC